MKRITIILFGLLVLVSGCKKDLTDLNVNPNDSSSPNPELLFKHSVKRGMSNYLTASNMEYNGISHWVMNLASRGGINPSIPYISPPGGDSFWNENYIDAMNNAQIIIDFESDDDLTNLKSTALIWKTFLAHRLTDLWGAMPYSEAFQGNPDLNFAPGYDSQQDVYSRMLTDLKLAAESIDESLEFIPAESDLLYNGNLDGWRRFAHSLRFRLAMRISNVNETLAAQVLSELESAPLFEDNQSSAAFKFNSVFNKPLFEAGSIRFQEGAQYLNPSKFLVDQLLETEDPRIKFIINEASLYDTFDFLDQYKGVPNLLPFNSEEWEDYNLDATLGDPLGEWGDVSRIGDWYMNNERPMPLLSYSELCLLQAEATLRNLWPGSAQVYLEEGIQSHMEHMNFHNYSDQENIATPDITTYIIENNEETIENIITQKWLVLVYENVFESYAEYRRTGFPILVDFYGEPIDESLFPKRLKYPNSEFTLNRDNYFEALESQGPDDLLTTLWWDN